MLVEAIAPGAQGRILAALLRVDGPRTISEIARLAGVSRDRAAAITAQLERSGLVTRQPAGPALLVALVEENPVTESLRDIENARERAISKLRIAAEGVKPRPCYLALYGSWARGSDRPDSDLDVAVIAGDDIDRDDLLSSIDRWSDYAHRVTGHLPSIVIADTAHDAIGPLWDSIRRDAVVLIDRAAGGTRDVL